MGLKMGLLDKPTRLLALSFEGEGKIAGDSLAAR
jgi:hypothetical protein